MKKNLLTVGVVLLSMFSSVVSWAQSTTSLRFNEVLVRNDNNVVDEFGHHGAWIEIYNSSAAKVSMEGCFLTTDLSQPKMFPIVKGDPRSIVPKGGFAIFWADNMPQKGRFHLNFSLSPEASNFLALIDTDGVTVIDSVTIPKGQVADVSYARKEDGKPGWEQQPIVTAGTHNKAHSQQERLVFFKEKDPMGLVVTIISMSVVFLSLILLYLIFRTLGKTIVRMVKSKATQRTGLPREEIEAGVDIPAQVVAAISMALYELQNSNHDEESYIMSIERVRRRYSPWSSKIQTLRNAPERR